MGSILTILGKIIGLAYPFLVLLVLTLWRGSLGVICLCALPVVAAALVVCGVRKRSRFALVSAATLAVLLTVVACTDAPDFLRIYPVVVSGLFLFWFGASLLTKESAVERYAALVQRRPLTLQEAVYCRNVTKVWCGFFVFNIAVATATVVYGSWKVWAMYNGCISYILMGTLFLGGLWVRPLFIKKS